ncbi:NAD(P)H-hydrate dehydratase [Virgibacillus sp. NKC19-3]|uniref:NAD(P)H-hydrate dehydratase n=1 Tax=Virgibacillus saliphilus TaxID=2831674 RepID=UPI001C9ABE63|nr:NAD(P)H-hydrate dehydratase [Virgibacillus sp. NKC19-3]MBY7142385.1 NAD(P)H-hydrate dehydratase [Virgibacillus sp. NKC19-3]
MYIVTAKEMYDIDHYTMQEIGMDGKLLMENAGRAICERIEASLNKGNRITVLAGSGNNGGDGFVIARTLMNSRYEVHVVQVVSDEKITGDALYHKHLFLKCGGSLQTVTHEKDVNDMIVRSDIVVDAMIGIGIKGELRAPLNRIVSVLNHSNAYTVSVDIPSGLPADEEGGVPSAFTAVQADYTFVVGAPKMSAFLESTAPFYGEWERISIGFPEAAFQKYTNRIVWGQEETSQTMPDRKSYDHKGDHGRGLVIGGSTFMPGALAMTVKAALRAGSGLMTAATSKQVIQMIASENIESTYVALAESNGHLTNDTPVAVDGYDAIALGIGMGRNKETSSLVHHTLHQAECPVVIDADGLYHTKLDLSILRAGSHPVIITPHPGEMAMLLDISVHELLSKPFQYASDFARVHNVYVVLKGKHTIISAPDGKQSVNTSGNPGLAKGGSGDVLTGIILAQIMQKQGIFQALCNACFIHGKSADLLVEDTHSYHDLMASDVIDGISNVYRRFSTLRD